MIWFTADYHLSHKNIMKYCNRPFSDVSDMNDTIIGNLESKVREGDTLYFLGDLTFDAQLARSFFERFTDIIIHFVVGNHDRTPVVKLASEICKSVSQLKDIRVGGQSITLCHYAMRVWNKSHFNSWQLYGHSHGRLDPLGKQYDVGIDNNNFSPISYKELFRIMKQRPDNFNYIPANKRAPEVCAED
jgi:calcineurin-like phosphoesterase family protein